MMSCMARQKIKGHPVGPLQQREWCALQITTRGRDMQDKIMAEVHGLYP